MEALITQSVAQSLGIGDGGKLRLLFVQVHVSVGKQRREGGSQKKSPNPLVRLSINPSSVLSVEGIPIVRLGRLVYKFITLVAVISLLIILDHQVLVKNESTLLCLDGEKLWWTGQEHFSGLDKSNQGTQSVIVFLLLLLLRSRCCRCHCRCLIVNHRRSRLSVRQRSEE